jgi:Ca2+-binding RTX toxin-like protein
LAFTTVRSASGVDFIGTPGVDVGVIFDETGNVTLSGLGDADVIQVNNSTGIQRTATINGGDGADQIFFNTNISDSSINGNKGADIIDVFDSVSNSFIGGGEGSDSIFGGVQFLASKIEGGAGADFIEIADNLALATVNGGDGNDTIDLTPFGFIGTQTFNNSSINGNAGADVINGVDLDVTLSGSNFIGGGSGDDTINFANATTDNGAGGFAMGFDLTGGSGNDVINGSNDNDSIWGNADNDTITGGTGSDIVYAGAGNDRINAWNDSITGGLGADDFVFAGGVSTFFVKAIGESAAATSGTARNFDSFAPYGAFAAGASGDFLDISAVTNQLAGGQFAAGGNITSNAIAGGVFANFADLKTALDLPAVLATASDTNTIRAYTFTATIAGTAGNYLWIQDSQRAYSSSDLLFQTTLPGSIGPGQITLV